MWNFSLPPSSGLDTYQLNIWISKNPFSPAALDIGAAGPVEHLLCMWSGDIDAPIRLNTRINLVNRLALMIEQRNIHVVFAWEFAAAVTAASGALAWICPMPDKMDSL